MTVSLINTSAFANICHKERIRALHAGQCIQFECVFQLKPQVCVISHHAVSCRLLHYYRHAVRLLKYGTVNQQ